MIVQKYFLDILFAHSGDKMLKSPMMYLNRNPRPDELTTKSLIYLGHNFDSPAKSFKEMSALLKALNGTWVLCDNDKS